MQFNFELERQKALLRAKMPEYQYLVQKTKNFIRWSLTQVKDPYVACSFGKDSSVMLHLVQLYYSDIPVRFIRWSNETEYLGDYDKVIKEWNLKNLTQIELSRTTLSDKRKERYTTDSYDSYFIGFRSQESKGRRISIKTCGNLYEMKDGKTRICPIADWKLEDIINYTVEHNLPVLDTYKKYGFQERTTSRVPREDHGIRSYSLKLLKNKDINSFNRLAKEFPEVAQFV